MRHAVIKDLTEGKAELVLWKFTIPMFVSVIFQQLYNIADSIIAGKYAGEDALAAVGASYPITMIFMAIAVGSNVGCSVVISQLFGGRKYREMKTAIYTTLTASFLLSVILSVAGLLGTEWFITMLHTPANIYADGALYLKIYIGGFVFVFLYNVCTGVFTSLGDSKTPLYFLIGSSVGNMILDWLFVAVLSWGVAGVAWATFIAQGVACLLVLIVLTARLRTIHTEEAPSLFSLEMLVKISKMAIPSILQQSFVSVGNIFIQRLINGYGSSVIAGYSAAIKLNTFMITSFSTMGNAVSGFAAQNIGAGRLERVKKGFRAGVALAFVIAVPVFIVYFFFGNAMMTLFMKEESAKALETGVQFLRVVSPFYFVISLKLLADGILRGTGAMKEFMVTTFSDLLLRVVLAFVFSAYWGTLGIWISWPVGWSTATVLSLIFYSKGNWQNKETVT